MNESASRDGHDTEPRRTVPFYSQKVDWVGEDSGFPNDEEVAKWQSNSCGIACARMIIDYHTGINVRYWDLLQRGLALGAYNDIGWIHRGLVDLVAGYNVAGKAIRGAQFRDLNDSTRRGNLCIASVSVGFRGGLPKKGTDEVFPKGGHLVVAFQNEDGELACHHPSSLDEWNKKAWVVPEEAWELSFSGGYMEFDQQH
jgi:hypothetical protein